MQVKGRGRGESTRRIARKGGVGGGGGGGGGGVGGGGQKKFYVVTLFSSVTGQPCEVKGRRKEKKGCRRLPPRKCGRNGAVRKSEKALLKFRLAGGTQLGLIRKHLKFPSRHLHKGVAPREKTPTEKSWSGVNGPQVRKMRCEQRLEKKKRDSKKKKDLSQARRHLITSGNSSTRPHACMRGGGKGKAERKKRREK